MSGRGGAPALDLERDWDSGEVPRILRCAAAEVPNVAVERRNAFELLRGSRGEPVVRCHVKVAQDCECEKHCSMLAARLGRLLSVICKGRPANVEVNVTGRFSRNPKPGH